MTHDEADRLVEALLDEMDDDVLMGSMLYAMTDAEKRRLKKRLVSKALEQLQEMA